MGNKLCIILSLLFSVCSNLEAQIDSKAREKDLIDIFSGIFEKPNKKKPEVARKVSFSIIPTSSTNGGKRVFVSSINAAFVLGNKDSTNFSSVFFLPYTNFSDNIGFGIKQNLFTARNIWNLPGEIRISKLAQYTYGLGSQTNEQQRVDLDYSSLRIYMNANRSITRNFFAGLGFEYDNYYNISSVVAPNGENAYTKYESGSPNASTALGFNFNILHDNRKNSINPADGWFSALIYRINPLSAGAGQWTSLYLDLRKYIRIHSSSRKIIAISGFYWGTDGTVPYLNLPGTQLEFYGRSGRGYSAGRFRGKEMLYVESEYRFDISKDGFWGGVLFINAQSLSDSNNNFTAINPAGGFGARIKFNKTSQTNLTLDFGFGKDSFGFYIGLGEFF